MPDMVGDLVCTLEHAGISKALCIGYVVTRPLINEVADSIALVVTTGALRCVMRRLECGQISLRL